MEVPVGSKLIEAICLAYEADQPLLLCGRHGVGKSQILAEAAQRLGVRHVVRDLSLMEPPDLAGLPVVRDGRMVYSPPAFLPRDGRGLLVFEELNRAPRALQAPCLQLLTARCLNDYRLPAGWLPVACINPTREDYHTHELDPALVSRFLRLDVTAEAGEWLRWARAQEVDSRVCNYISATPDIFAGEQSNPRTWTYVGALLQAADRLGLNESLLLTSLMGLLGDTLATGFFRYICDLEKPIPAEAVLRRYDEYRATVLQWRHKGRLDLIRSTFCNIVELLRVPDRRSGLAQVEGVVENLRAFVSDLPADLQRLAAKCARTWQQVERAREVNRGDWSDA